MTPRFTSFLVAFSGIVCFAGGVTLRLKMADMGVSALRSSDYSTALSLANHAGAIYDFALPLLWLGGALVFLAAVFLLRAAGRPQAEANASLLHHPAA